MIIGWSLGLAAVYQILKSSKSRVSKNYQSTSRFMYDRVSMDWCIQNFDKCFLKAGDSMVSAQFSTKDGDFAIQMFPRSVSNTGKISAYLKLISIKSDYELNITCRMCLKDSLGEDRFLQSREYQSNSRGFSESPFLFDREQIMSQKDELLPKGVLTIRCELFIGFGVFCGPLMPRYKQLYGANRKPKSIDTHNKLLLDLYDMFKDNEYSDTILVSADNKRFTVHRAILAARSTVFEAMFKHDMTEKNKGVVNIADVKAPILKIVLTYIYTSFVEEVTKKNVFDVYKAADKYDLKGLKLECIQYILTILSIYNVCKVILFMDMYKEAKVVLQKAVVHLLYDNQHEFFSAYSWRYFSDENPDLAAEFLKNVILLNAVPALNF